MSTLPPLSPNAWLRWDIVSELLPEAARTVLEVGCGQGAVGARLAARSDDYVGVEMDPTSSAVARARIAAVGRGEVRQGKMPEVLEPGRVFDLLCAFEVIEHIEDDVGALTAWAEFVRPGGWVLLSAPAWASRYCASDASAGHYRRYDPEDFRRLLEAAGLVPEQVRLYGAGLGDALEKARSFLGARRLRSAGLEVPTGPPDGRDPGVMAELTAGSGRMYQPPDAAATAVQVATKPFRVLQRRFPDRGPGLTALARKPVG